MTGDVTCDMTGDVTCDMTGDVTCDMTGDVTCDMTGDVTCDMTGDVTCDLTCDLTAVHTACSRRHVVHRVAGRTGGRCFSVWMLARWTCHHPFSTSPGVSGASSPDGS
jgi:hypothetical protein